MALCSSSPSVSPCVSFPFFPVPLPVPCWPRCLGQHCKQSRSEDLSVKRHVLAHMAADSPSPVGWEFQLYLCCGCVSCIAMGGALQSGNLADRCMDAHDRCEDLTTRLASVKGEPLSFSKARTTALQQTMGTHHCQHFLRKH